MTGDQSRDTESDEMVLISVDRTPEERREAYSVEWRDPANSLSLRDRLCRLFGRR